MQLLQHNIGKIDSTENKKWSRTKETINYSNCEAGCLM